MPWYDILDYSESLKKNISAYLIQRYLGQFFDEKLTTDQLKIDIFKGQGSVEKIRLDVQALNDLSEKQNWPVEFVDGSVEKLNISIPWTTLFKEASFVEVDGLKLTVQPKQRSETAPSMFESMWSSMTSSLKLAEEYARQESRNDEGSPYEGLESFANVIDSVLSKVQVKFINSVIQIEHVPRDSSTGVGVSISIGLIKYTDQSGDDSPKETTPEREADTPPTNYQVRTFTTKNFHIEGVSISTMEFPSEARTFAYTMADEETDDEEIVENRRQTILFAKFSKEQSVKVHMKQLEDTPTPKVSIDISLGHLALFLSPRQVHLLYELATGLASPDLEDHSNIPQQSRLVQKPMTAIDFQKVENELQQQMRPQLHTAGLQGVLGWSGEPIEDNDNEEFFPLHNTHTEMYDDSSSVYGGSLDGSVISSAASTTFTERTTVTGRRKTRTYGDGSDPSAEISHFNVNVSSLTMTLLEEDVLYLNPEGPTCLPSSVIQMANLSEKFFDFIGDFHLFEHVERDFDEISKIINDSCKLNHIGLMAVEVHLDAKEKTTSRTFLVSGSVGVNRIDIREFLYENVDKDAEIVPLLTYDSSTTSPLSVVFKHTQRNISYKTCPRTDLILNLGKCSVELDVTIIDRLSCLLRSPAVCCVDKKKSSGPVPIALELCTKEYSNCLKIEAASLNVKLRFPVPDFRPVCDLKRTPWWQRNLRKDYLVLKSSDAKFETSFSSGQRYDEYKIDCGCVDIFYNESERSNSLHLATISCNEQESFDRPRLVLKKFPDSERMDLEAHELSSQSTMSPNINPLPDSGPFAKKMTYHHSSVPHDAEKTEEKELIIPGDKKELSEFIASATESMKICVEISLPFVQAQLISKHTFEVIYNRINNDLLLWEPSVPNPRFYSDLESYAINVDDKELFSACKSGADYESGSDSGDMSESEGALLFYSAYERPKPEEAEMAQEDSELAKQSHFVIDLKIGKGVLSMNTAVRDSTTKNVIPGQCSDFFIQIENGSVFLVNGYRGNPDLGYVAVQLGRADLRHCDMMSSAEVKTGLYQEKEYLRRLHPTVYKSEAGILAERQKDSTKREMVTVAVEIAKKHESHHAKAIRISVGLDQATLRYRMVTEPNSWLSQLLDFFNVQDYPIPGYRGKEVLTELHLHTWDCAIDYRPLYLPMRSVITLGRFSITSHVSELSNTSILSFLAEECGLFISDKAPPKNGIPSKAPVDVKRDYVNIIWIGLFELSLKTGDKRCNSNPYIDLRASNDYVHIHTCSDSCGALMQLLNYIATDGDLCSGDNFPSNTSDSSFSSPIHRSHEEELIDIQEVQPLDISKLTKSQHQKVNEMIDEAIQEPDELRIMDEYFSDDTPGARLFFFPDESTDSLENMRTLKPFPQVAKELGELTVSDEVESDDDFYFVEEASSFNLVTKHGLPEIKWLTTDPVQVLENHFFVPMTKKDFLETPASYPMPRYKYTLCEMNIIWHLYGGNDFRTKKDKKPVKNVNFSDSVKFRQDEVSFTKQVDRSDKPNRELSWRVRGGMNRDHKVLMELELSKVKFQHETYPDNTMHASRQILLISELEIRDLLASSEFNKFLYQYTSEARPKPAQGHMIAVRAVHIRPDKNLPSEECCLKLSLLPLRLNIDQDSLKFLVTFFTSLGQPDEDNEMTNPLSSKQNTPTHRPPIMTVNMERDDKDQKAQEIQHDDNLIELDPKYFDEKPASPEMEMEFDNSDQPIYFKNVIFGPDVLIKIDYQGKHVEVAENTLASLLIGIIMGLAQLNCSELILRQVSYRHGLLGLDKLISFLIQEWLNDIKKNQLPSLLSGVGPMYSLVQLFQGIKDLFWMPIQQYQKDGRIVRGIQRGANSFTTSTAMAILELTTRLLHLIQVTAETAYDMLSAEPSVKKPLHIKGRKKKYKQPQDLREGVANAFLLVKEGIGETAETIVQAAAQEHLRKGCTGAVGGILRQIPPTIFRPIIIASEATNNVLGGMKYQLLPDARNEANQKWRPQDE